MKLTKNHWLLVGFNALYIIPFTLYYLSIGNYEFLIYIAVLVAIALLIVGTLKSTNLDLFALSGLSIWGLLHMLGGGLHINGATLYKFRIIELLNRGGDFYILKMDQVIHFYGFFITAIVVYQLLAPYFSNKKSLKLQIFLAWIGSMGLGALNEVVEFFAFVILSNTGVGDLYNTALDLVFNMFGALIGAFVASYYLRKK